jgi:hypothetical protein
MLSIQSMKGGENAVTLCRLLHILLCLFILVCVFDPADQVLGAKVWLFVAMWGATCAVVLSASDEMILRAGLLLCVLLFIAVPLLSILWYYITSGEQPYAGFGLLKGFPLVSVAIVMVVARVDVLPFLSATLTILALLIIVIFVAVGLEPGLFEALQRIGSYGELIRYFGLPDEAIMMALLLFPVAHAFFVNTNTRQRALAFGFLAYLGASAINPLLFSSTGMLIFSVVLADTFQTSNIRRQLSTWSRS